MGNVANSSGSAGTLAEIFHQDAYGNVLADVNTGAWASSMSGRHLTTKEYDTDGRLYYFWFRWYEPQLGRFLSQAPLPPNLEHPYVYALSNPTRSIDPEGQLAWGPIIGIGLLVKFAIDCGAGIHETVLYRECLSRLEDDVKSLKGKMKMLPDDQRSKFECLLNDFITGGVDECAAIFTGTVRACVSKTQKGLRPKPPCCKK